MAVGRLRNPSGQEVLDNLEEEHETHSDVNHGRLYPNLDSLINMGLVERGQRDRRTNEYYLTKHGAQYIVQRADIWANVKEMVRDQLAQGSI